MRRIVLLVACLLWLPSVAAGRSVFLKHRVTTCAGFPEPFSTDVFGSGCVVRDFTTAAWTWNSGANAIDYAQDGTFASSIMHATTDTGNANEWVKGTFTFTVGQEASSKPGLLLRATSSSGGNKYACFIDLTDSSVTFTSLSGQTSTNMGGCQPKSVSGSTVVTSGIVLGCEIRGTGNTTTYKAWITPSGVGSANWGTPSDFYCAATIDCTTAGAGGTNICVDSGSLVGFFNSNSGTSPRTYDNLDAGTNP